MGRVSRSQVTLTKSLQIKVAACQYGHVIEKCSFRGGLFSGCNQQFVNSVIVKLHENYLMPREEFITKGDMARELSFVLEGFVQARWKLPIFLPVCLAALDCGHSTKTRPGS